MNQAKKLISDPRATHFWDEQRQIGRWFKEKVLPGFADSDGSLPSPKLSEAKGIGVVWDTYLLYGPGAYWATIPEPLLSWGFPVFVHGERLTAEVDSLGKGMT